jgi:LTXXQ motif family protein
MPNCRTFALVASVALAATGVSTSGFAFGRGGPHGGGGGGHAFAGHAIGGHAFTGHAFASHALVRHAPAGHAFANHAFAGHRFAAHGVTHGPAASASRAREFSHGNGSADRNRLVHNEFAAGRFRGLHNFNRAGFNRNAFGAGRTWDQWGGRFWGAGWNQWGWGYGGWAGPVFWPFLYGDIFSFALWPYDYYDPFWAFGPDFVLASVYAPGPSLGAASGTGTNVYTGSGSQETPAERAEAAQSCGDLAPGVGGLPIAQIRQAIRPTADQLAALDELNAASMKANDAIKQSCPTAIPLTPIARLDTAEKRLQAMVDAIQIVRPPLEKFYDSLTPEQKQRFEALGKTGRTGASANNASNNNLAELCNKEQNFARLPIDRIEEIVQPNAQQQAAFDDLKKTSQTTADDLQASCPTQVPDTPVARLDATKARLEAMTATMDGVRPKLADFYASLSDDQKAKFNTMGPPPQNASDRAANGNGDR